MLGKVTGAEEFVAAEIESLPSYGAGERSHCRKDSKEWVILRDTGFTALLQSELVKYGSAI